MKQLDSCLLSAAILVAFAFANGNTALDEKLSRRAVSDVRAEFLVLEMSSESREILSKRRSNRENIRKERTEGRLEMLRENRLMKFREEGFRSVEPVKIFYEKSAESH